MRCRDRKRGLVVVVVVCWFCVCSVQADSAPVRQTIQEQSDQIRQDATVTQILLQKDKQDLQAKLQELTKDVSGLRDSLEEKKQALDALQKDENALKQQLQAEHREIEEVQGSLVAAAKNMSQLLQRSPLGPLMPKQIKQMARVADRQDLPRIKEIRSVVNTSLEYMDRSAEIERFSGSFVDTNGQEQTGIVVRVGGLAAMYHCEHGTGYLRPGPEGKELMAVGGDLSWLTKRSLRFFIFGKADQVPLDISKGSVFAQISREQTWGEWLRSGGFLVWPLFCIAGLALILVAERVFFMLRIRSDSNRIMDQITDLAQRNEWQKCQEVCAANQRSPLCRVLGKGLNHVGESRQAVENALQEGLLSQLPRLERFLPTLNVLAAIAPLLGLLGTVTGMISTFQAITVFGTGEPKVMAGGISEALITTQIGLGVAVPIMFLHHLLDRRVDKIIGDIEEKGAAFSLLVMSRKRVNGGAERDDVRTEHAKTS
jgi:biopolymer transport protein ExbB